MYGRIFVATAVLLPQTDTEAILHLKFEKVIKTIQNVPKTVDNH